MTSRWDMENYLNILFIRSRPNGRYIFQCSEQVFEVVGLMQVKESERKKKRLGSRDRGKRVGNERETVKENRNRMSERRERKRKRERTRKRLRVGELREGL